MPSKKRKSKISSFRKQIKNANKHTERGLDLLDKSMRKNGWIGAMTAAADGEIFDGSARLETVTDALPQDPIIVETDGKRPIIIKRTDIKKATDPKAVRLALEANRIQEIDLNWDVDVLGEIAAKKKELLDDLFSGKELNNLGINTTEQDDESNIEILEQYGIIIFCKNEKEQKKRLRKFIEEGLQCRALLS